MNMSTLSCGVAGIAGLTIINIAAHIFMFIIHLILTVFMAIDAGEFKKISSAVTVGTGKMLMIPGKNRELVTKNNLGPGGGLHQVTKLTIRVKSCFHMIGVPGIIIIIHMAGDTIAGNLIASKVTLITIQPDVSSF
jgi:hypothetical protein